MSGEKTKLKRGDEKRASEGVIQKRRR